MEGDALWKRRTVFGGELGVRLLDGSVEDVSVSELAKLAEGYERKPGQKP